MASNRFTDFFNQPLEIGDEVAFERPHYRELVKGVITGFTPKQVNIAWKNGTYLIEDTFRCYPNCVVRSPKRTLDAMNDLYALVPIEVRESHPVLVAARVEILNEEKA